MADSVISTLAIAAGTALVEAMAGDAWGSFRDNLAQILGSDDSDDQQAWAEKFEQSKAEVLSNRVSGLQASDRWAGRIESALERNSDSVPELQSFLSQVSDKRVHAVTHNRQENISGTAVIAGGDAHVGDKNTDASKHRTTVNNRSTAPSDKAIIAGVLVIIILILLGLGGVKAYNWLQEQDPAQTITQNSTCAEYLLASTEERENAVKTIGLELKNRHASSPIARFDVDYHCGGSPNSKIGPFIAIYGNG